MSILLSLCFLSGLASAATINQFENGTDSALFDLRTPKLTATVNVSIPAECHVLKATLGLNSVVPISPGTGCPEDLSVYLDNSLLWKFNGTGYGEFGRQGEFANEKANISFQFGTAGGKNGTTVRLPKNVIVENATLDIECSSPVKVYKAGIFLGLNHDDDFGFSVADAGDVNNDGCNDIVVGAMSHLISNNLVGEAYIFFGGASINTTPDIVLKGDSESRYMGYSVSSAGDVNGDGYDDVIVGAPWTNNGKGKAYLFHGGAKMDGSPDLILSGEADNDKFGTSVSGGVDLNNDSYDDIIVGAPWNDAGGTDSGRAYIYYGGKYMDNIDDVVMSGAAIGDRFGVSVSGAGDLNRDGYGDIIVGACLGDGDFTDSGGAYIYLGGSVMDNKMDYFLSGEAKFEYFGYAVSRAGDVNQDGYGDVIVGARFSSAVAPNAGRAYVFLGGSPMSETTDIIFGGINENEYFGASVTDAGDVDGDGYGDVVVGGFGAAPGCAHLYLGGPDMDTIEDASMSTIAGFDNAHAVAGGDWDGDGLAEMLTGQFWNSTSGSYAGAAFLYKSLFGVLKPELFIESQRVWNSSYYTAGVNSAIDLKDALNFYLPLAPKTASDLYGNSFVDIHINVSAGDLGTITLYNLSVVYDYNVKTADFTNKLKNYLSSHNAEKDKNGNLSVPIVIKSSSPGMAKLIDLDIQIDEAPWLVQEIPTFEMDEDSKQPKLIDLQSFFKDDFDAMSRLAFDIVSATNTDVVTVALVDNRYISVDALDGDQNDNWNGAVEMVVSCTDNWDSTRLSNRFNITIRNVNDPPVITSTPPKTAVTGKLYSYQASVIDVDKDVLNYSLPVKPKDMAIDSGSGLVQWIPPRSGLYNAEMAVSDGNVTVSQSFTITVPNSPPRINSTALESAMTGIPFIYNLTTDDIDGDILTYSILTPIEGLTIDSQTGRISWTPVQPGTYLVSVLVSDGQAEDTQTFSVVVVQSNRSPRFTSVPPTTARVGDLYLYNAMASDTDRDALRYTLESGPAGMSLDPISGKLTWTPTTAGNITVELKVSDGREGEALQKYTIVVKDRVKAAVEFTTPAEAQKVNGKLAITGKVTKGTLTVVVVQVRIDSGEWTNTTGNSTWNYSLDTTKLKNGKHTLQARAFDGMDYSDVINRTITVDNQKAAGKGFIPGFAGLLVPIVVAAAFVLLGWRRKADR